jgi:hypothetical protein
MVGTNYTVSGTRDVVQEVDLHSTACADSSFASGSKEMSYFLQLPGGTMKSRTQHGPFSHVQNCATASTTASWRIPLPAVFGCLDENRSMCVELAKQCFGGLYGHTWA